MKRLCLRFGRYGNHLQTREVATAFLLKISARRTCEARLRVSKAVILVSLLDVLCQSENTTQRPHVLRPMPTSMMIQSIPPPILIHLRANMASSRTSFLHVIFWKPPSPRLTIYYLTSGFFHKFSSVQLISTFLLNFSSSLASPQSYFEGSRFTPPYLKLREVRVRKPCPLENAHLL